MGKPALLGGYSVAVDEMKTLKAFGKEGVKSRGIIAGLKQQVSELLRKIAKLEKDLAQYRGMGITDSLKYHQAKQRAPRRLSEAVAEILRQPPERQSPERAAPERKRTDLGR